ncbi:hypothetical protein CCMA1212_004957 [Trichoderma ghanense]|uniref:Uncharacterized protein n=1 Tax=Trichoderma ghanense TaxID=65468 RepID=A0ABY2H583_9HYPO
MDMLSAPAALRGQAGLIGMQFTPTSSASASPPGTHRCVTDRRVRAAQPLPGSFAALPSLSAASFGFRFWAWRSSNRTAAARASGATLVNWPPLLLAESRHSTSSSAITIPYLRHSGDAEDWHKFELGHPSSSEDIHGANWPFGRKQRPPSGNRHQSRQAALSQSTRGLTPSASGRQAGILSPGTQPLPARYSIRADYCRGPPPPAAATSGQQPVQWPLAAPGRLRYSPSPAGTWNALEQKQLRGRLVRGAIPQFSRSHQQCLH